MVGWAVMLGVHETTAYRWYRDGLLPVPARKARLILVIPGTGPGAAGSRAGLYARVSPCDQKAGRADWLPGWRRGLRAPRRRP